LPTAVGRSDQLASCTVRGITVTTFGVDGALVDEQGKLLYPIISWKCPRTAAVMDNISRYMPARSCSRSPASAHLLQHPV
jgi:L-fuculokinase